ncbi:MAG: hypothetical protein LWY06_08915 [Firmicutes bacterium]|nr:hypothetical protein [Bacillota bacterium]
MDSISSKISTTAYSSNAPAKTAPKTESSPLPADSFEPSKAPEKKGGDNWLTNILNVRVPTVTPKFSEKEVEKMLAVMKPGDIITETDNSYPGWQFLEKLVFNSDYTHAAIYEGDGKFLEATSGNADGIGVKRNELREFLTGRQSVEIIRPPYNSEADVKAALDHSRSQLGKPYDGDFNLQDGNAIYCAELVYNALKAMPNPIEAPTVSFMGKEAVGPNAFKQIPGAEVVYSTGSSFVKGRISHYPVYMAAVAGATVGGMAAGPLGAIGGFAAGGIGAILTGNKFQAGKFSLHPE